MFKKLLQPTGFYLALLFLFFVALSWILFFQDTRALLAISNFYPNIRSSLFAMQTTLMHYKLNTVPTLLFAVFALASCFFYFHSLKQNISLKKTIIYSLTFAFIIFFSYPTLSTDIFSYIFSDRIATVYHQNVWQVVPLTHDNDPFAIMADWKNTTRVYGEVNQLIYNIPSMLGGNNLPIVVILYKFVSSTFALGIFCVLYFLLKETQKDKSKIARDMRMILWNPLFLLELFGSGHNDSIMIFFTLLAVYFFNKKSFLLSGIILACAVQVKLIPILLFIFFSVSLLQKKFYKDTLIFTASFVLVNILSFWLMGISPLTFAQRVGYNAGVYWQSLPNLFRYLHTDVNIFFSVGFFIAFLFLIVYQIRTKQNPILIYIYSLVFYLFFFITAYWNWYALWIVTLAPLVQNARLRYFLIILSFTSLLAYPLHWISLRYNYQNIAWPIVTYLFLFIFPLLVFLLAKRKYIADQMARLS
jgi:hypothetical protein